MYVLDQKQENKVYPLKPQFFYIKVGFEGVYIPRRCSPDVLLCEKTCLPDFRPSLAQMGIGHHSRRLEALNFRLHGCNASLFSYNMQNSFSFLVLCRIYVHALFKHT